MAVHGRDITRRDVLLASGVCALSAFAASLAQAQPVVVDGAAAVAPQPPAWLAAVRTVTGDAKVVEAKVNLELPEIVENGNVIPFIASVESPMTEASFVRSLRLYATANLIPLVATFRFTPESGKASVASRFRLLKSQDVVAIAEMSDGSFYMAKRNVKVTIGGCGG